MCVCVYDVRVCVQCERSGQTKGLCENGRKEGKAGTKNASALHLAPDGLRTEYSFFSQFFLFVCAAKERERETKNEFNAIKLDKI